MRVIAGQYRRRLLSAPPGVSTRPTSDRLRETLFNVLAPRLPGAHFLDLYAGSGANGIEALSRGATHVVFVEQEAQALAAIRANLSTLKIATAYRVEARPVAAWLKAAAQKASRDPAYLRFDIIFLDPPYDQAAEYAATLSLLGEQASMLLASDAVVVVEHRRSRSAALPPVAAPRYGCLVRTRLLEQGDAALSFYARAEATPSTRPPAVSD